LTLKIIPKSIRGRLLLLSLISTVVAVGLASVVISENQNRFIRRGLDDRLDAQIALLARAVRPDGVIDRQLLGEIGPFTQHDHGWRWQIVARGETVTSGALLPSPERRRRRERMRDWFDRDEINEPHSDETQEFYLRSMHRHTGGGEVVISAAAPREVVDRMRQAAITPLLLSLGALGSFLALAILIQLHFGLRPLTRLKQALDDVRAGRLECVPADQPHELRDVVAELNQLLEENAGALARARGHVANLAHGLKTPLTTLTLKLAESGRADDRELGALVDQIDRAVRHHLGRARAASPGAPGQLNVNMAAAIADLVVALGHIHEERGIAIGVQIAGELHAKCDPQDLDEMLGNLLDNAWKWAKSRVEVSAHLADNGIRIDIEDDGPGLSPEALEQVLVPGRRLDEREGGHGFGLPIARELAELHGGYLQLDQSPLGGLRVSLVLGSAAA
jgi:signal transduction histidine kinase